MTKNPGPAAIRVILMDCVLQWAASKQKDRGKVRTKYARKIYKLLKRK